MLQATPSQTRRKSWSVDVMAASIRASFDLSVKNPNKADEAARPRDPKDIIDEIAALDAESADILDRHSGAAVRKDWQSPHSFGVGLTLCHGWSINGPPIASYLEAAYYRW